MFDGQEALETVIRHATELDDDYPAIAPTVTALAACGDTSLVPRLGAALARFLDEENFYGRDLIAEILAGIQGTAALPVLLRTASRDLGDDQDTLAHTITELLESDRPAARQVVLELVTSDPPELRRTALWALGFVAERQDVELLAAAATDANQRIRSVAIGAVPDLAGDDRAFQVVVRALGDPEKQVRLSAVSRLGYGERADAVAPLSALAADRSPRVRSMVAFALGQLGSDAATPTLRHLLDDPDQDVREYARQALGAVGGPAAVDALLPLAADEDPYLRAEAASALAKAADSDHRVAPLLTQLARDGEAVVRTATLRGLVGTDGEPSRWAPLLIGLANDPDSDVRQQVAAGARRLAPDAAQDILQRYADDSDPVVRRIAGVELDRLTGTAAR